MGSDESTKARTPHLVGATTLDAGGGAPRPRAADQLRRGTVVGRYTILEPVGAGGMGVVYRAHDPELDRPVAIKLLTASGGVGEHTEQRAADLLREGRVAARLAHPNVVRVFDVGDYCNELFIAMEYLDGRTLEAWLEDERPDQQRTIDALLGAGRGLAAAHEAGLVHGDFKPRNVMMTTDGRVVVLDFGLGTGIGMAVTADAGGSSKAGGTPPYMAPELFNGGLPSMASDQFAYCVSVYQALAGERPFGPGKAHQQTGAAPKTPARAAMAPALWRAIQRGLAPDPAARFATLGELLERMQQRSSASRWAAGIALLAAVGAVSYAASVRDDRCLDGATTFAEIWDGSTRAELAARFSGTTWTHLEGQLDSIRDRWVAQWRSACTDRYVQMSQSPELYDRRMLCLDRAKAGVAAIVESLQPAEASLPQAVAAVGRLPFPERCGDADKLLEGRAPPENPADLAALSELEQAIARARTLAWISAERSKVLAEIPELIERAEVLGSDISIARAHFVAGLTNAAANNDAAAEEAYRRAVHHAEIAHYDRFAALVASWLVSTFGRLERGPEAAAWADYARAKLARVDLEKGEIAATLLGSEATAARHAGDTKRALQLLEEAAELTEGLAHPTATARGNLYNALGLNYRIDRQFDRSIEAYLEARAVREAALGPDHPLVGQTLYNLATTYLTVGDSKRARELLDQALPMLQSDGNEVRSALAIASLLGPLMAEDGDLRGAAEILAASIERARKVVAADSYVLNPPLVNLARVHGLMGDGAAAVEAAEEAVRIGEQARGKDYPPLHIDLMVLASAYRMEGRRDDALAAAQRALRLAPGEEERAEVRAILTRLQDEASASPPP